MKRSPLQVVISVVLLGLMPFLAYAQKTKDPKSKLPANYLANNTVHFRKRLYNTSLRDAVQMLQSHYGIVFLYESGFLNGKKVKYSGLLPDDVTKAAKDIFTGYPVRVVRLNEHSFAVLGRKRERSGAQIQPGNRVQFAVSGKVTDAQTGEPLPGVNVIVKGTTIGTATNVQGMYKLDIPSAQDTLVYTYIGYVSKKIWVDGRSQINVALSQKAIQGQQLVVIGYGTQKRENLTTSISTIQGQKIAQTGSVNLLNGLQGKIAGADITASSGRPGTSFNIIIRGENSLTGSNSPLFVVDGAIVSDINFLNPEEIKNISVLKSAAATAIYGSRGSNGVVIITTKEGSGQPGQLHITYSGYVGMRKAARMPDFMNGTQWWQFRQDAYITDALQNGSSYDNTIGGIANSTVLANRVKNHIYTYWPNYFLRTGTQDNQYISIAGVTNNSDVNYNVGLGYQNVQGNLKGQAYKQYSLKTAVTAKISDKWSAGANVNFSFENNDLGNHHAVRTAYRMSPLVSPYDSLGNLLFKPGKYAGISFTSSVNPLEDIKNTINNERTSNGIGNVYLQYDPVSWVQVKSSLNPEFSFTRQGTYWGPETDERQLQDAAASLSKDQRLSYIWDNQISASRNFGNHHVDVMGLYSIESHTGEGSNIDVANLPYNSSFYNLGTASDLQDVGSYFTKTTLMSYMFRVNYSYKDKYLLTVSDRWDGSSVLAPGHKWAMFPSISAGWRLSQEKFLRNVDAISELKLRASFGETGNNAVAPYSTQILANTQTMYDFGGALAKGFAPSGVANTDLTWEKTHEVDVGLDFGFFNERISGSIDYYNKLSDKLLLNRQLPLESGAGTLTDNIGSVRNLGIEVALSTVEILTHDFRWETDFTFASNRNRIVSLYGNNQNDIGNGWFIGEPISVDYTYVFDGIWQPSQAAEAAKYGQTPGQARVKDLNGDGAITSADRTIIGTPEPSWTGGATTEVDYKGFEFSATVSTRQGVLVNSPFHAEFLNLNDRGRNKLNVPYYMPPNNVTPTNYSNKYPQPHNIGPYWNEVSAYQNASYVEVNNIRLGYTLPTRITKQLGISGLNIYFNVQNPFVFTPYTGFDPQYANLQIYNGDNVNSSINYQLGINLRI